MIETESHRWRQVPGPDGNAYLAPLPRRIEDERFPWRGWLAAAAFVAVVAYLLAVNGRLPGIN